MSNEIKEEGHKKESETIKKWESREKVVEKIRETK